MPLWNTNQGGIFAAKAQVGEAVAEVGRVQNDLSARVATAFTAYAAARRRAERYQSDILPRAEETYRLSVTARANGQLEYLKVLRTQRAVAEARLELVRSLGEAWRASAELAGLMLEDDWPVAPAAK